MEIPASFLKTWVKVVKRINKYKSATEKMNHLKNIQLENNVDYTNTQKCFIGEAYNFEPVGWAKYGGSEVCEGCHNLGFMVYDKMLDLDSFMEHRAKIYLHFKEKHPKYLVKRK